MKRPATAAIFFVLAAVFVILLLPKLLQVDKLKRQSSRLDAEIRRLETQNRRLEAELKLLREDPVYLEKVARDKLNKAKEGEIVYKVVREGEPDRPS